MKTWIVAGALAVLAAAATAQDCVEYETYLRLHGTQPIGGESRGLLLENQTLFVATRQNGLAILDVSDPGDPTVISQTLLHQGLVWEMAKVDDIVYLAAGSAGLVAVDVSDLADPNVLFTIPAGTWCVDVLPIDGFLLASDYDYGVLVIENGDPLNPQPLGYLPAPGYSLGLAWVEDPWAGLHGVFSAAADRGVHLWELDLEALTYVDHGLFDTPGYARDFAVHDGDLWLMDGPAGIYRLDYSDLDAVTLADSASVQDYASTLVFDGDTGFLADGAAGLRIFDFSGAGAPALVSSIDAPNWTYDVATNGDYTYLANGLSDVRVIDTHILEAPPRNWTLDLEQPATAVGLAVGFGPLPTTMFLASGGVRVYDMADPLDPQFLETVDEGAAITAMDVSPAELLTGDADGTLTFYLHGVAGQAPTELGSAQLPGQVRATLLLDEALLASSGSRLYQFDPATSPLEMTADLFGEGPIYDLALQEIEVDGEPRSYVAAAAGEGGLRVYRYENGMLSGPLNTVNHLGDVRSVVAHGNYLYAGNEERQLLTVGHFNPGSPGLINTQTATGAVRDLLVDEDVLVVAQDSAGVQLYDLGSPWTPRYMGSIDTEGTTVGVAAGLDYLLAADGAGGGFCFPKQCQTSVDVEEPDARIDGFELLAATPNPFNPSTRLAWIQERAGTARLTVHNLLGQQVAVLHDGPAAAGRHEAAFDGAQLASGVYVVRLEGEGRSLARSISLIK